MIQFRTVSAFHFNQDLIKLSKQTNFVYNSSNNKNNKTNVCLKKTMANDNKKKHETRRKNANILTTKKKLPTSLLVTYWYTNELCLILTVAALS